MIKNKEYWDNFYNKFNTCVESSFARFVYKDISKLKNVKLLDSLRQHDQFLEFFS